jgi:rod shape-determining protein MreD
MSVSTDRAVEVFRVHPATLWLSAFAALVLQTFLPLKIPIARLLDFPLLVAIYFPLVKRNKVFGIGLGTGLGLLQDALSHGFIGISGMAKALVGYLAASASMRFELESLLLRAVMTAAFVLIHSLCLAGLQHGLLDSPPPFRPLEMASGILLNVALGLVLFQVLDRFRHPA